MQYRIVKKLPNGEELQQGGEFNDERLREQKWSVRKQKKHNPQNEYWIEKIQNGQWIKI